MHTYTRKRPKKGVQGKVCSTNWGESVEMKGETWTLTRLHWGLQWPLTSQSTLPSATDKEHHYLLTVAEFCWIYPTWSCVQLTFQSTTLPISSVGIASPWFYKCEVHGLKKSSLSLFYLPSYFSLPPSPSLSLSLSLFSYLFSQNCSFNHSSFNTEHFNLKKSLKPHFTIFIPYRSFIDVLFWEGINKIWKKLA